MIPAVPFNLHLNMSAMPQQRNKFCVEQLSLAMAVVPMKYGCGLGHATTNFRNRFKVFFCSAI